ncbi:OsmC family protein [Aquimarina hainanensis]|uniref:OsmC family protein n=1 Tax=Aquimarina hainanensis TaxID=1578017 RepID=A0ABW5N6L2_9FLAO|nr:OsmC family protein [Aquimarina sp. TRL1]QKX06216.1 OsmC family protein [Aquimarina sp. TRL1]
MKQHVSLVRSKIQNKYYTESKVSGFSVQSDEPIALGGTNKAPSPIDLMNSALASCTAMYLLNKAEKENINVGEIKIKIIVNKNEDQSFRFERTLSFEHKVSENEQQKLLVFANKTPVTKALIKGNQVITIIK